MRSFPKTTSIIVTEILTQHGELGTRDLMEKVMIRGPFSNKQGNMTRQEFADVIKRIPGIKVRYDPDAGNFWSISNEPKTPKFNEADQYIADDIVTFINSSDRRRTQKTVTEHLEGLGYKLPDKTEALRISNIMRKLVALGLIAEDACVKSESGRFVKTFRRKQ